MGDDHYCFLHANNNHSLFLLDEDGDKEGWDLPDDDLTVPVHLLPPYQDEDDETVLPSSSHPSYPYGNPYARASTSRSKPHHNPSQPTLFPTYPSLATSLTTLSLKNLHAMTTFGDAKDRTWDEMGLDKFLSEDERRDEEEALKKVKNGDPPQPTGQNAGDHPEEEEEGGGGEEE